MLLGQRGLTYMKLILAIVSNDDSSKVSSALTKNHFSVTKLATTGGFLLSGNTTFLIGTQDEKVDEVITIIADHSKKRKQMVPFLCILWRWHVHHLPGRSTGRRRHHLVLDVERFEKV